MIKKNCDKGYILEVDVDYLSKLHKLHSDMPFLPEKMKIDKTQKLVCNLRDRKKYVVHISILKQALNHGLKLKKVHRVIEFNQEAWLKRYIDMNAELRKNASIIEMKKVKVKMNKPIYLGLSILEISKIIMYEFWYDYMKKKYGDMAKLCYMDTDSLIMNIKTKDFYKDIARDVEESFHTSNYDVDRPLRKGKMRK